MSLCLHGAANQGQTAEEMAAAKAAEREEGEEKQRYLKIAEAIKDQLKSHEMALIALSAVWGGLPHRGLIATWSWVLYMFFGGSGG